MEECDEEMMPFDVVRILLIVVLGIFVSCTGILLNSCLLLSFSRLPVMSSNLLYLFLLAAFDIIVEFCFMLIFPIPLLWEYFRSETLYYMWHSYVRYVSTTGQVLIAASTSLIVAASLERYICSKAASPNFSVRKRFCVVSVVMLFAVIMKGSVLLELRVQHLPQCGPFSQWQLHQSDLANHETYKRIWMFWCRNILNVFIPFTLLLLLNLATISNLNRKNTEFQTVLMQQVTTLWCSNEEAALARARKRDATRTLAALVTIYLLSNTLNLLLTIGEFTDPTALRELGDGHVYKYLADMSSLLTISSTATRLPVYFHCNAQIRRQIRHFMRSCFDRNAEKEAII